MAVYSRYLLPPALLTRGLAGGQIDLDTALQLAGFGGDWPMRISQRIGWTAAVLAVGNLPPATRDRLEVQGIADAQQLQDQQIHWGLGALATLAPHLSPARQRAVRDQARPLLADQKQLADRHLWRDLAPDAYIEWLRSLGVLGREFWRSSSLNDFLERLSVLPDLAEAEQRQLLECALVSVNGVHEPFVDMDAESGIGGLPRYTEEEVDSVQSGVKITALTILAPLLPADLRERAETLAVRLGDKKPISLPRTPVDLLRRRWLGALQAPHPRPRFAGLGWIVATLHPAECAPLAALLVEQFEDLAGRVARDDDKAKTMLRNLADHALSPLAPVLSDAQTLALLAHYGLGAGA